MLKKYLPLFLIIAIAGTPELSSAQNHLVKSDLKQKLEKAKQNYIHGNYPEAIQGALFVLQSASKNNEIEISADAENLIGLVDLTQGQTAEALFYFNKAKATNQELGNQNHISANLINISMAHTDLKQLDSAIYYLKQSLQISRLQHFDDLFAMGNNHLADLYLRKGYDTTAETIFKSVINNKKYQNNWENSFAYTGLAKIRFKQHQYKIAATYADLAYQLAVLAHAKWDAAQSLQLSHQAYSILGNYKTAYQRLLTYKEISDSLFNAGKDKQINKLELLSKTAENRNLRNSVLLLSQQKKIDRLIAISAALILLTVVLLTFLIYKRVKHKNQLLVKDIDARAAQNAIIEATNLKLQHLNGEKDRLLSIISHDLRSPFAALQGTLMLFKGNDLSPQELSGLIEELSAQVGKTSFMLDSLLTWAANQLGGVSTNPIAINLPDKVDKVISFFHATAKAKGIRMIHQLKELPLVRADADQLRIMVQNLLSNALKFTPAGGEITVHYTLQCESVVLNITDTGVGISADVLENILKGNEDHVSTYGTANEKGIGLGLQLVRDFAVKNNLILSGSSDPGKGTTFSLTFNKAELCAANS
ncbi:tetratricopeptide repeat-containing sensor histidine kinase [Mucilaginibacter sp. RS28]|uniref:histidine kinase n=1 Tax=Mucilaginibacter straminoryzae TaxID=2932774 RepID=A0A9X1X1Z8_9SPHI|nr:tetratricopeptide repeat-containing sensor histidine kinase [Mucilaginibacter straminoryzae]MCJ8209772.1 tetratricopeptide repeat-containing sensor histidine kinase [Mucilaginibacter straminoryzae]